MKSHQLFELLKKRLGEDKFVFSFDKEKDLMHLDHKMLGRGMEIGLGKILSKYEEKKETAVDEVVYTIEQTFNAMEREKQQGFSSSAKILPVIRATSFPKMYRTEISAPPTTRRTKKDNRRAAASNARIHRPKTVPNPLSQ